MDATSPETPSQLAPDVAQAGDERERLLARLEELSQDFDYILIDVGFYVVLRRLSGGSARRLYGSFFFGAMQAVFLFASPLVVAVLSGTLDRSPVLSWLAFAVIWVVRLWLPIGAYATSSEQDMAVGRALGSVHDLRAVVDWTRRWRRLRFAASTSAALVAGLALVIVYMSPGGWATVPPGTIWLVLILLYQTGEQGWWALHKVAYDRVLARMRFDLPAFRPLDSPVVRQIIHNADGVTSSNAVWTAAYACMALVVLPLDIGVVLPVVAVILGVCYASVITDAISTRRLITHIVERDRTARLDDLGRQIEPLMVRVPDLSTDEEHRLDLLRNTYENIAGSPTTSPLLPATGKAVGAMLIPTLAFIVAAAAEGTVERGVDAILDRLGL
ncbi:MAG TPA: hypothetical protein VJ787_05665 [Thermoleophilia bacterium]|nr:MAG: hypothetical protein A2V85_10985 [Chloroflexi bacterium RBG_16_72_14]HJW75140.1 hypothetical protein [Thermoleophilia bacterium]